MAGKCVKCEGEQEADDGYLVCTKCGEYSEQSNFQSDFQSLGAFCNNFGVYQSDLATSGRRDFKLKSTKQHLPKWNAIISNGGDALRLTSLVIKGATQLFAKAYSEPTKHMLLKRDGYKRGLCAACLHIACQRNDVNIGVTNIWEVVQAEGPAFLKAKKDLKKLLDVHIKFHDRFDDVSIEVCLKKYGIAKPNLKEVISQIIKLAKDSQIHTGCKAEPLILAAAFIAWQNSTPNGFKTSISDFNIHGGSSILASIGHRLSELRKMLHHMVGEISWIDCSNVKPNEAVQYLKDIIRHQESQKLSRQLLSDSDEEEREENERMDFKPKRPKTNPHKSYEMVQPLSNSLPTNSEGRDLNCPELSQEDIPDSEMHHYLYMDKPKPTLVGEL